VERDLTESIYIIPEGGRLALNFKKLNKSGTPAWLIYDNIFPGQLIGGEGRVSPKNLIWATS